MINAEFFSVLVLNRAAALLCIFIWRRAFFGPPGGAFFWGGGTFLEMACALLFVWAKQKKSVFPYAEFLLMVREQGEHTSGEVIINI